MSTEENEMVQPCDGCDACECSGCCDAAPATTLQELKDAVMHLKELANRFPGRVAFHVLMDTPDGPEEMNFGGSNLLEPNEEGDVTHLRWMAARGYMLQSGRAMEGHPAAIGKGIEFLLAQKDGKNRDVGKVLAAILGGRSEG